MLQREKYKTVLDSEGENDIELMQYMVWFSLKEDTF